MAKRLLPAPAAPPVVGRMMGIAPDRLTGLPLSRSLRTNLAEAIASPHEPTHRIQRISLLAPE